MDIRFLLYFNETLEWVFLFMLYTFDRKPENRIAHQYLSKDERQILLGRG